MYIEKVEEQPFVVNPLTVTYDTDDKPRLVLDCRHINPLLFMQRYKYVDVSVEKSLFQQGDFVFTYDLKSA